MIRVLIFVSLTLVFNNSLRAGEKYYVFLKNKAGSIFNRTNYFDEKALERRKIQHLNLSDSTDFPLNLDYLTQINKVVDTISQTSRWFNMATVYCEASSLSELQKLWFVDHIEIPIRFKSNLCSDTGLWYKLSSEGKLTLTKQINSFGISAFEKINLDGKGVRIAIFDAGFIEVDTHPAFDHIRKENRIVKTWDFIKNKEFVFGYFSHGTAVMSCIGGIYKNIKLGCAPGAEFLLARTEYGALEPFSEEENWLAAAEWADKNGAQIINSSLGYTAKRYFPTDMNGKISLVARAATMCARKGILVVNAIGNDGKEDWETLGTPADADSILTVGGIDPITNYHIDFSSYGPTFDKRLKPNVSAMGSVFAAEKKGTVGTTQGTSFSAPLVAGFVACVLQLNPGLKCQELLQEIELSGNLAPYYDYAHGYGIPQASHFLNKSDTSSDFNIVTEDSLIGFILNDKSMKKQSSESNLFYYHIQTAEGYLRKYAVGKIDRTKLPLLFSIEKSKILIGETIRFHFLKTTKHFQRNE